MESLWNGERLTGMPAGAVEYEHHLLVLTRSYRLREMLQGQGKDIGRDGGQEQPVGTSVRLDEQRHRRRATGSDAAPPRLDVAR